MANPALIKTLEEHLKKIQIFSPQSLTRETELGSQMGFQKVADIATDVIRVFRKLDPNSIYELPPSYLSQLRDLMNKFDKLVALVNSFDPQHNPQARLSIIDQWEQFSAKLFDSLVHIVTFQKTIEYDPEERLKKDQQRLHEILDYERSEIAERAKLFEQEIEDERIRLNEKENQLDAALSRFRKVEAEFKDITENMQEQAAESGITQEAAHFDTAANDFGRSANKWKWAVFILSIIVIASVVAGFALLKPPEKLEEVIHFVASKVMIFGTLFYLLGMSVKSYMYNTHNKIVNLHRKNALLSYRALIGGASDPAMKDRVLEHAVVCIYTHQETGYLKGSPSKANSIIEIMPKAAFEGKLADAA